VPTTRTRYVYQFNGELETQPDQPHEAAVSGTEAGLEQGGQQFSPYWLPDNQVSSLSGCSLKGMLNAAL